MPSTPLTGPVVVVGASGLVGRHVVKALEARGVAVLAAKAPRLPRVAGAEAAAMVRELNLDEAQLAAWRGATAIINAAGDPGAGKQDEQELMAANGALPGLLGRYAKELGIPRFVHVSSAVVQGRRPVLDASDDFDPFSAYARSKILGERLARQHGPAQTVCYRPPGVHHESRSVTRMIGRIASSPFSSVAAPGDQPTPQALAENIGAAIAELACCEATPPPVVIHPWEQLTCRSLLELLGERHPRVLPRRLAAGLVRALELAGRAVPALAANARRIEMIWFGQRQATSWLTEQGWTPPKGPAGWTELKQRLAATPKARPSDDPNRPRISVCMATYNGADYVIEQLNSILPQLDATDEVIICDDRSTDGTAQLIADHADPRIKLTINAQNLGYTKNFEKAMGLARGEIIMLSDQDDVWAPERVSTVLEELRTADFVLCDAEVVDAELRPLHRSHFERHGTRQGFFSNWVATRYSGCAMAFHSYVLDVALPFPARSKLCSHDYWLALIAELYFKTRLIRQPLFKYRRHGATATTAGESSPFSLRHKLLVRAYVLPRVLGRWRRARSVIGRTR